MKRFLAVLAMWAPAWAWSGFSVSDCVLREMRGASNEVAARLIREACEAKAAEYVEARRRELDVEFGEEDSAAAKLSGNYFDEGGGVNSVALTNETKTGKSISYARLVVSDCHYRTSTFAYTLKLSPGNSIRLAFPRKDGSYCGFSLESVRVRPERMMDFYWYSGKVDPLAYDPFDDLEPPGPKRMPSPAAAPAPAPFPSQAPRRSSSGASTLDAILEGKHPAKK